MQNKKALLHTSLLEKDYVSALEYTCCGKYSAILCTCMYTVMYSVCKHKEPNQWDTEDQYTGTKYTYKGPIIWAYGDTMHVHMNNPIGTQGTCVYKGPTLRGSYAQIEDQSYEYTMHVQLSNPMGRCM